MPFTYRVQLWLHVPLDVNLEFLDRRVVSVPVLTETHTAA